MNYENLKKESDIAMSQYKQIPEKYEKLKLKYNRLNQMYAEAQMKIHNKIVKKRELRLGNVFMIFENFQIIVKIITSCVVD